MPKTLFVVNANAGGVRKNWQQLEPKLSQWVTNFSVAMTNYPEDVTDVLNQSVLDNIERIVSIGGDGTNNIMVNAIMEHREKYPDHDFVFGTIPAGTGSDFARGIGLPHELLPAAEYVLKSAKPRLIDIGLATFAGQQHYFLNMANAGIANDVVQRVERSPKRPWSFFISVVSALLGYDPEPVTIELDGKHWFEGHIYVTGIANGTSTGQGILLAPDARLDDGYFDVVVGEKMPFLELLQVFPKIYSGQHIGHPHVFTSRAKHARIIAQHGKAIGMDLDGEPSTGATEIIYEIVPSALKLLM